MMNDFHFLNDKLSQSDFYRAISFLKRYKVNFDINFENFNSDEFEESTIEESYTIDYNNINEYVGFIVLNGITIDSLTITKDEINLTIYSDYIYFKGSHKKLVELFSLTGFNPDHWIKSK